MSFTSNQPTCPCHPIEEYTDDTKNDIVFDNTMDGIDSICTYGRIRTITNSNQMTSIIITIEILPFSWYPGHIHRGTCLQFTKINQWINDFAIDEYQQGKTCYDCIWKYFIDHLLKYEQLTTRCHRLNKRNFLLTSENVFIRRTYLLNCRRSSMKCPKYRQICKSQMFAIAFCYS